MLLASLNLVTIMQAKDCGSASCDGRHACEAHVMHVKHMHDRGSSQAATQSMVLELCRTAAEQEHGPLSIKIPPGDHVEIDKNQQV